ncbi:MAG: sugar MFS transporter [Vicingaceae bacterium]
MNQAAGYRFPFAVITTLFFMWGLITVLVDSLIPRLKDIFELSYFQAGLVQFAFFIAYGLVSIPAGSLLHKLGYQKGLVLGLITMGLGCLLFYPAAGYRLFSLFLLGYFILAAGMTILQVAANPYVTVLGTAKGAASRLNLAQAFNSLGTAIAPALGAVLILSDRIQNQAELQKLSSLEQDSYYVNEAQAVQQPFLIIAGSLLLMAFLIYRLNLPQVLKTQSKGGYLKVIKNKKLLLGAIGIFVYVGCEVSIGSYLVNYLLSLNLPELILNSNPLSYFVSFIHEGELQNIDDKGIVGAFVVLYWSGAMIGRFAGAYLSRFIRPALLLGIFALAAILMLFLSLSSTGLLAMFSILAVGLFNSIMFPTIFSLAIEDLDQLKAEGSGILCTAIAGGAFIPPLYGLLTDFVGFQWAFVLLIICYAYIYFYSRFAKKITS